MKKIIFFLLLFLLVFSSCSKKDNQNGFKLFYYSSSDNGSIISKTIDFPSSAPNDVVKSLYLQLASSPDKQFTPIIPQNVSLLEQQILNNVCSITLSDDYTNLDIIKKNTVNACITKTLCQLPYIDSVRIRSKDYCEQFTSDDFLIDIPQLQYDTYTVNLYFANSEFNSLTSESGTISLSPDESLESVVFNHLIEGPTKVGMQKAIPDGTILNSIYVNDGVCHIDLSAEFVENAIHDEQTEEVIIYSIVNTMTELPMINSVKFLIDGNVGYGYQYQKLTTSFTHKLLSFN